MQLLRAATLEEIEPCPYLPGRLKRYESFYATAVDADELAELLAGGWRKFGPYFFRPACPDCRACIPLRVPVDTFRPSRSQRRVLRLNADIVLRLAPLQPTREIFALHARHAARRFGQQTTAEEFLQLFYTPSTPALQGELRLGERLVGIGWVDTARDALSSVYFSYDPDLAQRRLGILSILREIAAAGERGLPFYYLGYYVAGCPAMAYKDQFRPRQHYDWTQRRWHDLP